MMLDRFGVRGRLTVLLVLAFLVVAAPFAMGEVRRAATATSTAELARNAELIGDLNWQLQQELLLTSVYLVVPASDPVPVREQQWAVGAAVEHVRAELGTTGSDELVAALSRIGSLDELRHNAARHSASVEGLRRTHRAVSAALVDALRLEPEAADDPAAGRDLAALEAPLLADNEKSQFATSLVTAPVRLRSTDAGWQHASAHAQILTQRFIRQADPAHAQLVALADIGDDARLVESLAQRVPQPGDQQAVESYLAEAVPAVERLSSMRRLVRDRVAGDIAAAAAGRASAAVTSTVLIGVGIAVLLAAVLLVSVWVSRSIAVPLRDLTRSAITVAEVARRDLERLSDTGDPADDIGFERELPQLTEVRTAAGGEVGELAVAFNRVQTTAAAMLQRQVTTRQNVSIMFADVARRTQNLVHRQLTVVDGLERDEQDPTVLAGLYQIDHLSTRLRRNADKLLVVSGSRDPAPLTRPAKLTTVLRSATAEIEDYRRVGLDGVDEVTLVSALGTDLVLLFAELIENATVFSPPGTRVEISTSSRRDGTCTVAVVDHGIGLPTDRRIVENERLSEPERIDAAPPGLLGLFVVGRIARRHQLRVELAETPGGGLTANVVIPASLVVTEAPAPNPRPAPAADQRAFVVVPPVDTEFPWFDDPAPVPLPADLPADLPAALPADPAPAGRAGLRRRVPDAQLPEAAQAGPAPHASEQLSRRVPGASLAPELRHSQEPPAGRHPHPPALPHRDPDADRDAFDGFADGFARAAADPHDDETKERQP